MRELRCAAKKHGEFSDTLLEVKCSSKFCGAKAGAIVIHVFDLSTGDLIQTRRFKEPHKKGK